MKKFLIFLFILSSCGFINDNENHNSENLISQEKMIDIIYDMSLISVSKGINKRILENNGMKPKSYILKKYNIDSLQFASSNEYYSKDLEQYLFIYEKVLEKLEFNRNIVIDSIENYKIDQARRSKEVISESMSDVKLSKPIG
tara:strand:- start:937 stop:1365 length:429 start_codon:yes stop_codon:yes gene_type:complete